MNDCETKKIGVAPPFILAFCFSCLLILHLLERDEGAAAINICIRYWPQASPFMALFVILFHLQSSCPLIKNILLLDSEGKRVAVKYFSDDWPTNSAKLAFEKFVYSKTVKTNARTEGNIKHYRV